MGPEDTNDGAAPIDRAVLENIRSRFAGSRLADSARIIEAGRRHLRVDIASEYYPSDTAARFEICWYRNDDFTIHYQEERPNSVWKCRWDRHPNSHNSRDHFHPPPKASRTAAEDDQWPADHRDMCQLVLDFVEKRVDTLWKRR